VAIITAQDRQRIIDVNAKAQAAVDRGGPLASVDFDVPSGAFPGTAAARGLFVTWGGPWAITASERTKGWVDEEGKRQTAKIIHLIYCAGALRDWTAKALASLRPVAEQAEAVTNEGV
jgi:hypothetical protein